MPRTTTLYDAVISRLIHEQVKLMNEHGPMSEPVRQFILAQRGRPVGDYERLATTLVLLAQIDRKALGREPQDLA